ncbi:hypothetical protein T10_2815 [Trichinella papuae]|uniref:Uncharacterized protein n=1 Tax=Trichinella papuae TaxID=268474 RepID=A0A0V1M4V9_9BILA|nr:hypothetical protein T10_2815 [Trichinella papuae]
MAPGIPVGRKQRPLTSARLSSCLGSQSPSSPVDRRSVRLLPSAKGCHVSSKAGLQHWTPDPLQGHPYYVWRITRPLGGLFASAIPVGTSHSSQLGRPRTC